MHQLVLLYSLILVGVSFAFPHPTKDSLALRDVESWPPEKRGINDDSSMSLFRRGSRGVPSKIPLSSSPPQRVSSWERLSAGQSHPPPSPRRTSELGQAVDSRPSGRRGETSVNSSPARERPHASGGNPQDPHKRTGPPLANPRMAHRQRVAASSGDRTLAHSLGSLPTGTAQSLHDGGFGPSRSAPQLGSAPAQQNSEARPIQHPFARDTSLEAINARMRAQREIFPEGFPGAPANSAASGRSNRRPGAASNSGGARNLDQLREAMSGAAMRAARQPLPNRPAGRQSEQEKFAAGRNFMAGLRNPPAMGHAQQGLGLMGQAQNPQAWGASFAHIPAPPWAAQAGGHMGFGGQQVGIPANAAQGPAHHNVGGQANGGPNGNGRGAMGQAIRGRGPLGRGRGAGRGAGLVGNAGGQVGGQGAWGAMFQQLHQGQPQQHQNQQQNQQPQNPGIPHVSSDSSFQEHFTAPPEDRQSP